MEINKTMKLKDFIENFIGKNTLVRLWYKTATGGHIMADNNVLMEWEVMKGEYSEHTVLYVKDILIPDATHSEAVNIVIEKIDLENESAK